mgnify:CR=1 FL=1
MTYKFALCNFLSENPIKDVFIISYFLSKGCTIVPASKADFLICDVGHQSTDIRKYPKLPKLLVMGENIWVWFGNGNEQDENVKKNILDKLTPYNYALITNTNISHPTTKVFYMPFAMQYANIAERLENKKSPLLIKKEKFCCFCVKNASPQWEGCVFRDQFFQMLNKQLPVDSLGPHLNNVGGPIPREGFDEYVSKYKFMICFENSSSEGYITEKLLRCILSGVIGIYWGTPTVFEYINPKCFIFVDKSNPQAAIDRILHLNKEENYEEYLEMLYEEPILKPEAFDRNRIYKVCDQFLEEYKETFEKNRTPVIQELIVPRQIPGTENIQYVLQINNCKKYESRRLLQTKTWCQDIPSTVVWYHVIGDPTLTECIYKPEEHLLIVPAGDTYECLPQKVYHSYTFAYKNFPSAWGLCKVDDDAIVDIPKLITIWESNKHRHYYGGLVQHKACKNFYGYDIAGDKSKLPIDGIETPTIDYIVGGTVCLSMNALSLLAMKKEVFDQFIYEDIYVAESIQEQYPAEHVKLFSNDFTYEYPVFIIDRVNVKLQKFFERFEHYYKLFCKPQRYLLVFPKSEEERIHKMRVLFPNCDNFGYEFIDTNTNLDDLANTDKYTGVLNIAYGSLVNFVELEKLCIENVALYDRYQSKDGIVLFVTNRNELKPKEPLDFSSAVTNMSTYGGNIYDFAHSGIFSSAWPLRSREQAGNSLEICNRLFSYTPFYSTFYQGKIFDYAGSFGDALNMITRCLNILESRESLCSDYLIEKRKLIYKFIITMCSQKGYHELLYFFAQNAAKHNVLDYEMKYELYMAGLRIHNPDKSEFRKLATEILDTRSTKSRQYSGIVWSNITRFVQQIGGDVKQLSNMPAIPKEFSYSSLALSNAPISTSNTKTKDGKTVYIGILRTHSYYIQNGNYLSHCEDGIIRTENYYLEIDENLSVLSSKKIEITDKKPFTSNVIGLEDCRYFRVGEKEYILGVSYEHVENSARTMVYYELEGEKRECKKANVLKTRERCEKNWLPVIENNSPKFIYSLSPTRIVELSGANKGIRTHYEQACNFDDERGSCIIDFNYQGIDGYLMLTHRVIFLANRIYLNRFFFLNKSFQTLAASTYFYFLHVGIEYCLGCARGVGKDEGKLIFGVSKTDKETYVVSVSELKIVSMLQEVEKSKNKDEIAGYVDEQ